jgi:hypothetical protein
VLINREKVFVFKWPDYSYIYKDISPPIIINIIKHKAWQAANFLCPKPLLLLIIKMLKEQLNRGMLKYFKGLYRNLWFLVKKKKPGEYKLINLAIYLNIVIRRDVNLPLSINEFIDEFVGYYIISLVNLYSGYN